MLHKEFAVDPSLFKDFSTMKNVLDGMGLHTGRMLAKYPKDWLRMAYKACDGLSSIDKSRAEIRLKRIKHLFLMGGRNYEKNNSWLDNTLYEHEQTPFQAVVVSDDTEEGILSRTVVRAGDLDPEQEPWKVSTDCVRNRDAVSLCSVAKPLLHISKEVVFVDRYFTGNVGHGKPLAAFLTEAFHGAQLNRIEYHCDDRESFQLFASKIYGMYRFLSLPAGFRLRFVRWKRLPEGDSPHPRYVLTDKWGLRYDYGLSEEDGVSTDICIMGSESYERRKGEYAATGTAFEFADGLELRDHKIYKLLKKNNCFVSDAEILPS